MNEWLATNGRNGVSQIVAHIRSTQSIFHFWRQMEMTKFVCASTRDIRVYGRSQVVIAFLLLHAPYMSVQTYAQLFTFLRHFHLECFLIASHCCTVSRIHGVHNVMLLGYISTGEQHTARQRTTNMRIRNKNKIIIIDIHERDISSWNILLVFKHDKAKKKKKIRRRRRHTAYWQWN